jgi:hypothetical protein
VFVRIRHFFGQPKTVEYTLELVQAGGSKPSSGETPAEDSGPGLIARFVSFAIWSGIPLVLGLLIGAAGGYLLGRRRRA